MTELSKYFANMAGILPATEKLEITLFEEGFSNQVYLIRWDHVSRLVLRIPVIDNGVFYINRCEEIATLKSAATLGLSPAVMWHDQKGAVACQFVSQPSLDWSIIHKNRDISRIAGALAAAHRSLPIGKHQYAVFDVIQHYLQEILIRCHCDTAVMDEYNYLLTMFNQLTPPDTVLATALCHNDLNPKNILMDDEQLWLIDWEYSGAGDPLFDLAVVVKSHNLDDRQTLLLLESYQKGLAQPQTHVALQEYVKAYGLREMAWLLLKYVVTPNDTLSLQYYYEFKATPSLNPFHSVEPRTTA